MSPSIRALKDIVYMVVRLLLAFAVMLLAQARPASLLDTSFNPGSGANGIIEKVIPLASGKILICGNFSSFNNQDRGYVARLNSDGTLDTSFWAKPGYWVRNMAVQTDGKIVIGGYFTTVDGVSRNLVARLNSDGSLDPSFNPGTGATDIIAGGVDGNIDPFIFWVAIQQDGKILITGNFTKYNGQTRWGLARLNTDGSLDTSFNCSLNSWGRHILIQPNNQILLSGWFTEYNGVGYNRMVRINPADGSADTSFNPYFGDKTAIYCSALTSENKIIASGHSLNELGLFKREFARLNQDGTFDDSFIGSSNDKTESVLIQPDGKILIAGNFSAVNNTPRKCLARLNPDGSLDNNFQADIDNFVWNMALQSDGKLLICGGFFNVDGQSRNSIARLFTGLNNSFEAPRITAAQKSGNQFNVTVQTFPGKTYKLQALSTFSSAPSWATVASVSGDGTAKTLSDPDTSNFDARFYRVSAE